MEEKDLKFGFGVKFYDTIGNKVTLCSNYGDTDYLSKEEIKDCELEDVFCLAIKDPYEECVTGMSVEQAEFLVEELKKGIEFVKRFK